jgi:hypothetical protein
MANQFKVEDFISLCGSELILVGGQAVNLWGERYVDKEPSTRAFLPFTSRDADFTGGFGILNYRVVGNV